MSGAQYNSCDNNGDYSINNQWGTVNFVNMVATNADFGTGTSHAFCITNTSIKDNNVFAAKIYPNPVNESLSIIISNGFKDDVELSIYDIRGQLVFNSLINSIDLNNINVESLNSGCYLIKLSEGHNTKWLRFIKN